MTRIDWLEDSDGNLTRVLISDEKFKTFHMSSDGGKNPTLYAIELTDDMVDCIAQEDRS